MPATEDKKLCSDRFSKTIIARAVAAALGLSGASLASALDEKFELEEITVTARQRQENLQEVPMYIQALTGEQLQKRGITTLEDFSRFVPSLSIQSTSPGQNTITFRGVSDGGGFLVDPTAAIYLDEQPMTVTSQSPDIYPADIARIEALAGPQSTLYGASSQSGTVRYVTNKPNASEFSGDIGVGLEATEDGDPSYDFDATVNIPIIKDKVAIRLTGFSAKDGGYIDNVLGTTVVDGPDQFGSGLGGQKTNANAVKDDINSVDWIGGRAQVRWLMNDNWSATVSTNYQKTEADGWYDYDKTVGDLETIKFNKETRKDEWSQISLVIEADLGFAQLVSATSYFDRDIYYERDTQSYVAYYQYNLGIYAGYATYNFGLDPIGAQSNDQNNKATTQEIRLSASTERLNWTAGLFYQETKERWDFYSYLNDYSTSPAFEAWSYYYPGIAPTDSWWLSTQQSERTDSAVFGEIDLSITDKIDLLLGGRYYDVKIDRDYYVARPATRPEQTLTAGGDDNGFVPKVGLQYNFNDAVMLYGLYSEGYRVGGINRNRGQPTLPVEYGPDTLKNMELGLKSLWMDGRIQLNATIYTMEWQDVQLEVTDPSFEIGQPFQVVVANLGDATVEGLDMDFKAAVTANLEVGFNVTYIDKAEVDAPASYPDDRFPGGEASLGLEPTTELPLFADTSYSAYMEYNWQMHFLGDGDGYIRLQYSYIGDSLNQLFDSSASPRAKQGDYSITDIIVGYEVGQWTGRLYVNNIDNERGITFNDSSGFDPFFGRSSVSVVQPRSAGFDLRYRF